MNSSHRQIISTITAAPHTETSSPVIHITQTNNRQLYADRESAQLQMYNIQKQHLLSYLSHTPTTEPPAVITQTEKQHNYSCTTYRNSISHTYHAYILLINTSNDHACVESAQPTTKTSHTSPTYITQANNSKKQLHHITLLNFIKIMLT
jgi:hypothetical protein